MEVGFILVLSISVVWLLRYFLRLGSPASSSPKIDNVTIPLTVIICAKNEAANLAQNLPAVLNQQHPSFEVIVVNDNSTDESDRVLLEFEKQYQHLRVIHINEGEKQLAGKKELLAKAMREAKHEAIVVTDADCRPAATQWLKVLSQHAFANARIVLGYSPFQKDNPQLYNKSSIINYQLSILNKLIRFEATQTAWQYFSSASKGKAYMGVGRNMLFYKTDYLKWFENTQHKIAGGDDDLFVNWLIGTAYRDAPTAICLDEATFVFTEPQQTFADWIKQKTRHTQASYYYSTTDKVKLFAFALAQFGLYASCFALMFFGVKCMLIAVVVVITWSIVQMFLSRSIYNTLQQSDLILWIPLLQPLYVFSISLIFLLSLIKRSDTWN